MVVLLILLLVTWTFTSTTSGGLNFRGMVGGWELYCASGGEGNEIRLILCKDFFFFLVVMEKENSMNMRFLY